VAPRLGHSVAQKHTFWRMFHLPGFLAVQVAHSAMLPCPWCAAGLQGAWEAAHRVPCKFLHKQALVGPLLARDMSGPAFGALGDPEVCVSAHVLWLCFKQAPVGASAC